MNGVFTMRRGCQVILNYENLRFACEKNGSIIYLHAADYYTANMLDCAVNSLCGVITHMNNARMRFEFRDADGGYEANCLFTCQTSCHPFLGLPPCVANGVFTKREGCCVILHYDDLRFACIKDGFGAEPVSLQAADKYTANMLDCDVNQMCGVLACMSVEKGVQKIMCDFRDANIGYEMKCVFTYQTSCLPWLMGLLHPGKSML